MTGGARSAAISGELATVAISAPRQPPPGFQCIANAGDVVSTTAVLGHAMQCQAIGIILAEHAQLDALVSYVFRPAGVSDDPISGYVCCRAGESQLGTVGKARPEDVQLEVVVEVMMFENWY